MSMNVFRFFRPPGEEKEERSEKRRAQVRRAQQTYRLRKDQYTRALEKEVSRLRSVEVELARENRELQETVRAQQRLFAKKGSWGDLWESVSSDEDVFRTNGLSPLSHQTQHSHLALDESTVNPEWPLTSAGDHGQRRAVIGFSPAAFGSHHTSPSGPKPLPPEPADTEAEYCQAGLSGSDTTSAGMQFVLALESPCLEHIHGDPSAPQQPNGHALTTSAYVLSLTPSAPLSVSSPESESIVEARKASIVKGLESAPRTILDRLLALSTTLALEDEVTPVQAWERIREQMEKWAVDSTIRAAKWKELVRRLAGLVQCHGFGAVLKFDLFEQVVRDVMVDVPVAVGWGDHGFMGNTGYEREPCF